MRRVLLLLVLLLPSMASAQSFIRYYPPASGSGSAWDGGAFTDPAEGPDGCTNPAYGFGATDTDAGFCLSAANSISLQTSPSGNSRSYINANTLGIGLNYINSSGETTAFTLLETNATFHFTDATVLNITDALGTGFISAQGSGAAVARTITNTDGCLTVQNGEGGSANPILNVDTNCVPTFSSGTADPPATCTPPELYYETDTFELSLCSNTDTWEFIITMNAQTDDATVVGSGTGFALKVIPDCDAANNRLNYDTTTNAWSCASADITLAGIAQSSAADKLLGRGSAGGAGDFEEITLGSGLSMSGTTLSASGSAVDPLTTFSYVQEFGSGLGTDGNIGDDNWQLSLSGTMTPSQYTTAVANHPGIVRLTTNTSDNHGGSIWWSVIGSTDYGGEAWEANWIVRVDDISSVSLSVGMVGGTFGTATEAIRAFFDTDLSHATWIFQVCDSSTSGCQSAGDDTNSDTVASTKAPSNGVWQRIRIRRVVSGVGGNPTIYFSVGDGAAMETEKTFCSSGCDEDLGNLPTADMRLGEVGVQNRTTAARNFDADLFTMTMTGLVRY